MNFELRTLISHRLDADGLSGTSWAGAVLAACDGRDALDAFLTAGEATATTTADQEDKVAADAYLTSITVQGFRGIGPTQTLTLAPGPGLTLVIGRNGSGKSSFAEALEVLFTGDSQRWANRTRIWKDGWRNLHHPHPTAVAAELVLAGQGPTTVSTTWEDGAALEAAKPVVQPRGKPRTTLRQLGWKSALELYRPFLSYNELGSMLDEGPSKLYDALAIVLGLEELVSAQQVLSKARTERQAALKSAEQGRSSLVTQLKALLEQGHDERAATSLAALQSSDWGLDTLRTLLAAGTTTDDSAIGALQQAASFALPDLDRIALLLEALGEADAMLQAVAGTDSERSRKLARLLEAALELHRGHTLADCPVCGTTDAIAPTWAESTQAEIADLRARAAESDQVHAQVHTMRQQAIALLSAPPARVLEQLQHAGVDGVERARAAWTHWHDGARLTSPADLAAHIDTHHVEFIDAVSNLKENTARELQLRQDRWNPVASAIAGWITPAADARRASEDLPFIKDAEDWLKGAAAAIRDERFAPIADQAMETWRLLRQNSSVELGRIQLVGTGKQRRVSLDVTIDGVSGAALGVMSQGELHSLALSLFLPRATLEESPFRFVVIDDPVQSMDPARVDGLARVLEQVARTRQVVVLTHDTRLPDAVRRLGIGATMLSVTRRPESVVEIRTSLDPVQAHIEDALALVHTADLPRDVLQRVVPGFCRSALEAAFMQVVRRRRLAAGDSHEDVESKLEDAKKLTPLAALALFDDQGRGGDVLRRLNQFGHWAGDVFRLCNEGAHASVSADLNELVRNTESLCEHIVQLR